MGQRIFRCMAFFMAVWTPPLVAGDIGDVDVTAPVAYWNDDVHVV